MKKKVLAVSITRLYDRFGQQKGRMPSEDDIYDMARWAWRSREAESCRIVFACVHRTIKGVFEVREWFSCGAARNRPELRPSATDDGIRCQEIEDDIRQGRRMAFIGNIADCARRFIGKDAPRFYGPIGYLTVNC